MTKTTKTRVIEKTYTFYLGQPVRIVCLLRGSRIEMWAVETRDTGVILATAMGEPEKVKAALEDWCVKNFLEV
jgi:hypothetical protein